MTIYEMRTTLTVSGGSANALTLNVRGGLLRQVLIRANTATTIFRADLVDGNSTTRRNYSYHETEINDSNIALPIHGGWTVNITNASVGDTFTVVLGVQE